MPLEEAPVEEPAPKRRRARKKPKASAVPLTRKEIAKNAANARWAAAPKKKPAAAPGPESSPALVVDIPDDKKQFVLADVASQVDAGVVSLMVSKLRHDVQPKQEKEIFNTNLC